MLFRPEYFKPPCCCEIADVEMLLSGEWSNVTNPWLIASRKATIRQQQQHWPWWAVLCNIQVYNHWVAHLIGCWCCQSSHGWWGGDWTSTAHHCQCHDIDVGCCYIRHTTQSHVCL